MWDFAECHGCWPFFGLLFSLLWPLVPTAVIIPIVDDSILRSTASLVYLLCGINTGAYTANKVLTPLFDQRMT
jgi:hypothetical protein